jgi:threonylcarbamoyladenosine tRNA methylthiotransferase MtaB
MEQSKQSEEVIRKRVALTTLGCKLNQYDSEMVLTQFRAAGYEVVDDAAQADICIVNTCSVTAIAERKDRNALRSMHRKNPSAKLLAIGCMAERAPDVLAKLPGVTAVIGNKEKERIVEIAASPQDDQDPLIAVGETTKACEWTDGLKINGMLGRTRGFLKVQDGCSQHCTYCIVPRLRGKGRSQPISSAVEQARLLAENGFSEIVVTGVALGTYGFDFDRKDALAQLLSKLEKIDGLKRIRLGSVEPWAVTDRFLDVIAASDRICPHLHVPLQSCDDAVLRRMNRRYTVADISHLLDYAYKLRDDWGFGSDIIVGFPGETDEQYDNTCNFLSDSRIAYLHVFPFSERPETAATKLSGSVSTEQKHPRVQRLKSIDRQLRTQFRRWHLNSTCSVLFENRYVDGLLAGHAHNYLDVFVEPDSALIGTVARVHITQSHPEGVKGVIQQPSS